MKLSLLSGACAASMLLALTPAAQAADIDAPPEPNGWGWYVSVFGGWSMPDELDLEFETNSLASTWVERAEIGFDDGFMGGVALGVQVNAWLRGEVELSGHWHGIDDQSVVFSYTGPSTGAFTTNVDGDESAFFLLASLWLDVPVDGVIRPYFGGGVGLGRLEVDLSSSAGYSIIDDADWGFAYQLGAGVTFDVAPTAVVDVGYRFKAIDAHLDIADDFFDPLSGTDADYRSHNVLLGLRFGF